MIKSLGAEVAVVSFGSPVGVRRWIDETGCKFDVLCDEKREIYSYVGLLKPTSKMWHLDTIQTFSQMKVKFNIPAPKQFENVSDDLMQMGGDFILDKDGNFVFIYRTKAPNDRPTIDQIIASLKTLPH